MSLSKLCLDYIVPFLLPTVGHTLLTGTITGRSIVVFSVVFPTFLIFSIGLDFTTDGKYMALAERRNCKDCISIFACTSWQLVKVYIWNISRMYAVGLCS